MDSSSSWRKQAFSLVAFGCVQFVILTFLAMLFYPGGTLGDPSARGYSFFTNFFSELGMTRTHAGGPNTVSFVLFWVALTLAGAGLVLFSLAFRGFFIATRSGRVLSTIGTLFGVVSGLCFIGVAFTPANRLLRPHSQFVLWAFQAFPVAALCYGLAILLHKGYPKRFALVFLALALLLTLYIGLLMRGPALNTPQGVMIQAAGQKVIVYASIISILIQSLGARKRLGEHPAQA